MLSILLSGEGLLFAESVFGQIVLSWIDRWKKTQMQGSNWLQQTMLLLKILKSIEGVRGEA